MSAYGAVHSVREDQQATGWEDSAQSARFVAFMRLAVSRDQYMHFISHFDQLDWTPALKEVTARSS